MVTRCGLNRLNLISTFLGHHLRNSKTNPELLQALAQFDQIFYAGAELGREEEAWALQNGVKLRVKILSYYISAVVDRAFFLDPELYRIPMDAPKPAALWFR